MTLAEGFKAGFDTDDDEKVLVVEELSKQSVSKWRGEWVTGLNRVTGDKQLFTKPEVIGNRQLSQRDPNHPATEMTNFESLCESQVASEEERVESSSLAGRLTDRGGSFRRRSRREVLSSRIVVKI